MLHRLVAAAAIAGIAAGLLLTAIQQIEIAPLIRAAESMEASRIAPAAASIGHATGWSPQPGWQRLAATAATNVVLAVGYGLLLGAAMSLRRQSGWRRGLLWGIAGYAVFFVAPALGLPPELPGGLSAPLATRQLWWVATVGASAAGCWLAAFAQRPILRIAGLALTAAPHLIAAPLSSSEGSADAGLFVGASYLANAALWTTLGAVVGLLAMPGSPRRVVEPDHSPRAAERGALPPR